MSHIWLILTGGSIKRVQGYKCNSRSTVGILGQQNKASDQRKNFMPLERKHQSMWRPRFSKTLMHLFF